MKEIMDGNKYLEQWNHWGERLEISSPSCCGYLLQGVKLNILPHKYKKGSIQRNVRPVRTGVSIFCLWDILKLKGPLNLTRTTPSPPWPQRFSIDQQERHIQHRSPGIPSLSPPPTKGCMCSSKHLTLLHCMQLISDSSFTYNFGTTLS